MKKLFFVTGNKNKAHDAQAILGFPIEVYPLHQTEIQDISLENIVKYKAEEAYKVVKKPLIVEDVGLYVDAWNGFPGPFIKFIEEVSGYRTMLKMLETEKNRKITSKIVVGFHDGKTVHLFSGEMKGKALSEVLDRGWGFATIFHVNAKNKPYPDLSIEEQHEVSHRGVALRKLKKFLQENKYI